MMNNFKRVHKSKLRKRSQLAQREIAILFKYEFSFWIKMISKHI